MKLKNGLIGFMVCLALSLPLTFAVGSFVKGSPGPPLPVLGRVQGFNLRDATGQEFNSGQLHGKVWIASFFFTTCSGICPTLSKRMASLSRTFEQVQDVALVSITVNPEQDSPEILARYAEQFKGDRKNWYFLTGSRETITKLAAETFKLGDVKEPVFHSALFPLVDSKGFIRGYYDGTEQKEIDRLIQDAAHLAHR